jgi:hypothetical protein
MGFAASFVAANPVFVFDVVKSVEALRSIRRSERGI